MSLSLPLDVCLSMPALDSARHHPDPLSRREIVPLGLNSLWHLAVVAGVGLSLGPP